jgi:hypothetical protein
MQQYVQAGLSLCSGFMSQFQADVPKFAKFTSKDAVLHLKLTIYLFLQFSRVKTPTPESNETPVWKYEQNLSIK